MKIYNLSKPRKYTDGQGNEKTAWDNVGQMLEWTKQDGTISRVVKIPAIGLEAQVYEQKPKDQPQQTRPAPAQTSQPTQTPPPQDYPTEENINPDDIPF